jgi:hypothetical protein
MNVPTPAEAWRGYHRGKALLWGGFVLYLPVMAFANFLVGSVGAPETVSLWIAGSWLLGWFASAWHLARFRCPQCGGRFFMYGITGNVWATKCHHCGKRAPSA